MYCIFRSTDTKHRAAEILGQAEEQLRLVIQESLKAGAYPDVVALAGWADQIAAIRSSLAQEAAPRLGELEARSRAARVTPAARRAVRAGGRKKGYPRFRVDGDALVKISWSKNRRRSTSIERDVLP